ncbi:MAG: glycosyltransferase family 4 protein [Candidatus Krumholzibacteriia bacterium]
MKVICITNLFPDVMRPGLAPFNKQQILHLAAFHELRLIVPVPWPRYAALVLHGRKPEPLEECRGLMTVHYPPYFYTPKIMRRSYGAFYERSIAALFDRLVRTDRPDVVYATWAYPDCFAAALLAGRYDIPFVARIHGSDINEHMEYPVRKRRILDTMRWAREVVSVSAALRKRLVAEGVDAGKIHVIYNGIDRGLFRPFDRGAARRELHLDESKRIVLYAGNFEPVKGIDILIEAFGKLDTAAELHIVGDGPERRRLAGLARALPPEKKVMFHGRIPHRLMGTWLNACDVFCLPSLAEGTPNVVLEALACRTPVVAADTGGVPEVVSAGSGVLFRRGDAGALAGALTETLGRPWDRARIECPAGSWEDNARALGRLLERAARENAGASR